MNQAPAQPHTADAREHAGSLSTPGGGPCTAAAGEDRPPENTGSEPPRHLQAQYRRVSCQGAQEVGRTAARSHAHNPTEGTCHFPELDPCVDTAQTDSGGTANS